MNKIEKGAIIVALFLLVVTILFLFSMIESENRLYRIGSLIISNEDLDKILYSPLEGNIEICEINNNKCGFINKVNIEK